MHKQFTLLVGENGSGKTSVLDALTRRWPQWWLLAFVTRLYRRNTPIL
ncbi:MAG: AAA family ATPase [Blastocatellia bacterium]